jgi:hypothetical protein
MELAAAQRVKQKFRRKALRVSQEIPKVCIGQREHTIGHFGEIVDAAGGAAIVATASSYSGLYATSKGLK